MPNSWIKSIIFAVVLLSAPAFAGSLFEDYFAKTPQVPFPISELRKAIADPTQEPEANDFVFIPDGRSIQRANTDLCHPRVVTAVETPRGTTYLGYSEKAQAVEVISWNESKTQFEFLQIKNYGANGKPELTHAERNLCLSCHQNGGPIFARAPWREINNPFQMQKFYDTCLTGEQTEMIRGSYKLYQGIKVYAAFGGKRSSNPGDDNGTSCILPGLNPGCRIDSAVRGSEHLLQEVQACRSLCAPGDEACADELKRLTVPASAFSPLNNVDQTILKRLVSGALPTSILPDRNPNVSEAHVFLLKNGKATDLNLDVINGDYLAHGDDAKWSHPEEKRQPAFEFLGFDFMNLPAADQAGALTSLVRTCLRKGPAALVPEPSAAAVEAPREGVALFAFYCGKCHGDTSNIRLPLTDLSQLKTVTSDWGETAEELLANHEMPRTAPGVPPLPEDQRAILIRMLEQK